MRRPTPISSLYAWWRAALDDPDLPREEGNPQCGYYKLRYVKGGPWVLARIWCERSIDPDTGELEEPERILCEIEGRLCDPTDRWTHMTPITRNEFEVIAANAAATPAMAATMVPVNLTERAIRP